MLLYPYLCVLPQDMSVIKCIMHNNYYADLQVYMYIYIYSLAPFNRLGLMSNFRYRAWNLWKAKTYSLHTCCVHVHDHCT